MEISSSLSSLDDKVTKKVRMRCKDAREDDHLMVVDDDGNRNGFEKPVTSSVSFKDMLLGISRGMGNSMHEQDKELRMIYSFLMMICLDTSSGLPDFLYRKSILMSIGKTIGHVIKLDDDTGNAHTGRFVPMAIFLDLNKPLVSKIKVDGRIQQVEYESLPNICFSYGRFGHLRDSCSFSPRHDQATKQGSYDDPILVENREESDMFGPWMAIGVRDSALSAKDDIMGCGLEKDKIDGALGLADPNANASFKKDIISSKVVAMPSIGLRIQGLSGPFKMSNRGLSLRASSSSLKFKDHKRLRRGSRNFRGKGSKFNVKALGRESVAEAMTRVVYRINSDGLIADTNNSQGEHLGSSEMTTFFRVVRDYFAEFDVDVTTFLETRVNGMKADGTIAKIGLDCSHRIESRDKQEHKILWDWLEQIAYSINKSYDTPKSVRFGSMTTRLVRSSHRLDCRPGFTYRTRFNQFLGLGL
ncbi:hypothetical protein Gorai_002632, partial [Gossypium raimondii]|nr:hypothetical protein [Gossypium raimondii]